MKTEHILLGALIVGGFLVLKNRGVVAGAAADRAAHDPALTARVLGRRGVAEYDIRHYLPPHRGWAAPPPRIGEGPIAPPDPRWMAPPHRGLIRPIAPTPEAIARAERERANRERARRFWTPIRYR